MGYRSDVGYKIRFDNDLDWHMSIPVEARVITTQDMFNTFIAEAKSREDTKLCFEDEDGNFKIDETYRAITFYAGSVKWYENFDDVKCHEALLDLCNEWIEQHENDSRFNGSPIRWSFVRIGEESDDVEEKSNNDGWDLCYTSRSIEFG
jgi:hypothetical protein